VCYRNTYKTKKRKLALHTIRFPLLERAAPLQKLLGIESENIHLSAAALFFKEGRCLLGHLQILETCCHSLIMIIIGEND
jgi:hypothetical protein